VRRKCGITGRLKQGIVKVRASISLSFFCSLCIAVNFTLQEAGPSASPVFLHSLFKLFVSVAVGDQHRTTPQYNPQGGSSESFFSFAFTGSSF
jgi:hypothetical protein